MKFKAGGGWGEGGRKCLRRRLTWIRFWDRYDVLEPSRLPPLGMFDPPVRTSIPSWKRVAAPATSAHVPQTSLRALTPPPRSRTPKGMQFHGKFIWAAEVSRLARLSSGAGLRTQEWGSGMFHTFHFISWERPQSLLPPAPPARKPPAVVKGVFKGRVAVLLTFGLNCAS